MFKSGKAYLALIAVLCTFSGVALAEDAELAAESEGTAEIASDEADAADAAEAAPAAVSKVPFNIGLVPYVDINAYHPKPQNNFSLDFIVGHSNSLRGLELAGGVSWIDDSMHGVQYSGLASVVQGEVKGVQIGLVNYGGKVTGHSLQVGLVNISPDMSTKGGTLGLINATKNGRHSLEVWTTDIAIINVGTRLGSQRLYSLIGFSLQPKIHTDLYNDETLWGPGLGIGGDIPVKDGWSIRLELYMYALFDETYELDPKVVASMPNIVTQIRLLAAYQINDLVGVYFGPAMNINMGFRYIDAVSYLPESATLYTNPKAPPMTIAPGFVVGVQLF